MIQLCNECCWDDIRSEYTTRISRKKGRVTAQVRALIEAHPEETWNGNGMITLAMVRLVPDTWKNSDTISEEEMIRAQRNDLVIKELLRPKDWPGKRMDQYTRTWIEARRDRVVTSSKGLVCIKPALMEDGFHGNRVIIPERLTLRAIQQ